MYMYIYIYIICVRNLQSSMKRNKREIYTYQYTHMYIHTYHMCDVGTPAKQYGPQQEREQGPGFWRHRFASCCIPVAVR